LTALSLNDFFISLNKTTAQEEEIQNNFV